MARPESRLLQELMRRLMICQTEKDALSRIDSLQQEITETTEAQGWSWLELSIVRGKPLNP
jgi:hypothetical protein